MQDKIIQIVPVSYVYDGDWGPVDVVEIHGLSHSGRMYRWSSDHWVHVCDSPELEVMNDEQ